MKLKRTLILLLAVLLISAVAQQSNASTGTDHGFFWQCYVSGGSASISFPGAGTYPGNFAVTWSNVGDVVAGKGWNPGAVRTVGYNIGSLNGSYNNFSVYGWTTNPLIEYYVCEKGSVASGSAIGTLSSDGHTYTVYKHQQVNQPSIQGTATFWQYLSNWGGTSLGSNHSVTLSNHFNYWKSHIGSMGALNLQILAVEAYGGKSGNCNATVWSASGNAAPPEQQTTVETGVPSSFSLGQNYPNPFNPTTNISFALPEDSFVSLKVYNTLGKEIADLGGEYSAGQHAVPFNASNLASGVYFYTIRAGQYTSTKKMILQK